MSFYKNIGAVREVKKQKLLDNFNDWLWEIQAYDINRSRFSEEEFEVDNVSWILRFLVGQALDEDVYTPTHSILIKLYHAICEVRLDQECFDWKDIRREYKILYGREIYDDFELRDHFDYEIKKEFKDYDNERWFISFNASLCFEEVNRRVLELR